MKTKVNWVSASEKCQSMFPSGNQRLIKRPHLASIANKEEENFIKSLLEGTNNVWVGAKKMNDGSWIWLDGTEFSYTYWAPGEPNNYEGEDYILINWVNGRRGMMDWNNAHNDVDLKWVNGFLCQYKAF